MKKFLFGAVVGAAVGGGGVWYSMEPLSTVIVARHGVTAGQLAVAGATKVKGWVNELLPASEE